MQAQCELEQPRSLEPATQRKAIHDLRNLFAIVGAAKALLEREPGSIKRDELLRAIGEATRQGGQLTTELLANGAARSPATVVDVGERLARLAPMLRVLADVAVNFLKPAQGSNLVVRMVPSDLDAVIVELVSNAAAAGANSVTVRARRCAGRVWLMVADNGCGMSAETLARARRGFDLGLAHGSGLSRVRHVMENCGGRMHLRSRPGQGTQIGLAFPAPCGTGAGIAPSPSPPCVSRFSGESPWKRSICSCNGM